MFSKIVNFIKKDAVLTIAWVLAIISAFIVHPSAEYADYIDFRSLGILWSLMMIMQIFKENGLFSLVGKELVSKTKKVWQLVLVLVMLCFFFSMLITNDVALITFVPLAIMILRDCGLTKHMIPVIVLQTIAANLGSMMTPMGNPQNLYLYGLSGLGFGEFAAIVGPYTAIVFVFLFIFCILINAAKDDVEMEDAEESKIENKLTIEVFGILFLIAICTVLRLVDYKTLVLAVFAVTFFVSRNSLLKVDYALLLTFIGFFIFTGNMGRIEAVKTALNSLVAGRELIAGVICSQVISNVPAALLLSGFSSNLKELILGVNFGGLGTLIASMASLISFKLYSAEADANKGTYMVNFTLMNVVFLVILLAARIFLVTYLLKLSQ